MRPILEKTSLTKAAVYDDDNAVFAFVVDSFSHDLSEEHAAVYTLTPSRATELGFFPFMVSDVTYGWDVNTQIAIGQYGEAVIIQNGDALIEQIADRRTIVRGVITVGQDVIACGANSAVFRRQGKDNWVSFGPDEELQDSFPGNHLEAIAGYATDELYAAGRDGVIWWYDGAEWTPIQCSSNLSFLCVDCADDGFVYLGGQGGLIARGRRDSFVTYTPDTAMNDIWAVKEFQGKIYCSMMRALATWTESDGLVPNQDAMAKAETFYNLGSGSTHLWSLGEKDVLRFDGSGWTRVDQIEVA